jgi:antitoxin MazE
LVEALELKEGDEVAIQTTGARQLDIVRQPTREELVLQLRKYRGMLPADFKFDREEANAR